MTWNLWDAPCFVSEDGRKTPGHEDAEGLVVEDHTYQTPLTRGAYDKAENRFIVLLPDSVTPPSSWISQTREEVQAKYGAGSDFDLFPSAGWEA